MTLVIFKVCADFRNSDMRFGIMC